MHRRLLFFFMSCVVLNGCQQFDALIKKSALPDMGPQIPATVRMKFDPALTAAIAQYSDACNHPQELRIGPELEDVMIDAAHRTFQTVLIAGHPPANTSADVEADITLQQSGLKIQTDGVYDRLPTELSLESLVVFRDRSGKVLGERTLKTTRNERIILEPTQHRCAYVTMDSFLHDTAVVLGTQFMRESRTLFEPAQTAAPVPSVAATPAPIKPPVPESPAVSAVPSQPQTVVQPKLSDNVDQIPKPSAFQQPHTFVIAIGISTHRDPGLSVRKYASLDAEMVANYFQTLGGVPPANIRLMIDMKALRPDIEETLLDWLPTRVTSDSVVIIYFSGQAKVSATGETFLVPYEGGASASRLYPLKDLQASLSRLKAKQIVLLFDGSVSRLNGESKGKSKEPQWEVGGNQVVRLIATTGLRDGLESDKLRHGLFTYYLLRGLKGEADDNLDGEVMLGELAAFISRSVPPAAKSAFHQEQYPQVLPAILAGAGTTLLTKPAH